MTLYSSVPSSGSLHSDHGSSAVTPAQLGVAFVRAYFDQLANNPSELYTFYEDDSHMLRLEAGQDTSAESQVQYVGQVDIHEKVMSLGYANSKVLVESTDVLSSGSGVVSLLVTGILLLVGQAPKPFVQSFLLVQNNVESGGKVSYYVRNDILRLLPPVQAPAPASGAAASTPVKAPYKTGGRSEKKPVQAPAQQQQQQAAPAPVAAAAAPVAAAPVATPAPAAAAPVAAAPVQAPTPHKAPRNTPAKAAPAKAEAAAPAEAKSEAKPAAAPAAAAATPAAAPAAAAAAPVAAAKPAAAAAPAAAAKAAAPAAAKPAAPVVKPTSWARAVVATTPAAAPVSGSPSASPSSGAPSSSPVPAQQQQQQQQPAKAAAAPQAARPAQNGSQSQRDFVQSPVDNADDGFKTVGREQKARTQRPAAANQGGFQQKAQAARPPTKA